MYDLVVLGDGLTGLASAALLASEGRKTLIVETGNRYECRSCFPLYHNDASIGSLGQLIRRLALDIHHSPVPIVDKVFFPDFELTRPRSLEGYRFMLEERYPEFSDKIYIYFKVIENIGREWVGLSEGIFRFLPSDIPYCMRYAHLSYADFIGQTIGNSPELLGIICAGLPNADIALVVMAGYLYGQVFDSSIVQGGLLSVRERLLEYLDLQSCKRISIQAEPKSMKANGHVIGVRFPGEIELRAKTVLDTRGDHEELQPKTEEPSLWSIAITFCSSGWNHAENGPSTEIWWEYPSLDVLDTLRSTCFYSTGAADDLARRIPLAIWNPMARSGERSVSETRLRIDFHCHAQSMVPLCDLFLSILMDRLERRIPDLRKRILSLEVCSPHWHSLESGIYKGTGLRWASSVRQVFRNPMHMELIPGYFDTARWGFAWFSAAATASRQISNRLKVLDSV